ncbi:MAG: hypothetical protein ACE5OY_07200 [Candidatus Bathyarchaeia archaeon]
MTITPIVLVIAFAAVFVLVIALPALAEFRKRRERGPRVFPETTVVPEKPEIPEPSKRAKPKPVEKFLFAEKPKRAERVGQIIRVVGDVTIPSETRVREHVVVDGSLKVGRNCRLAGSIKAKKGVEIGERTIVYGNVLSGRNAIIGPSVEVKGVVDANDDLILHEGAKVGSASAGRTVKLGSDVTVRGRTQAGVSIETLEIPKPVMPIELPRIPPALPTEELGAPIGPVAPARGPPVSEAVREARIVDRLFLSGKMEPEEYVKQRGRIVASTVEVAGPAEARPLSLEALEERLEIPEVKPPEARPEVKPPVAKPKPPKEPKVEVEVPPPAKVERRVAPPKEEFFEMVSEIYRQLSTPSVFGLRRRHVEISELRKQVCREANISEEDFDDQLTRVIRDHPDLFELSSAPYSVMRERSGDILEFDGRPYFYIRIRKEPKGD